MKRPVSLLLLLAGSLSLPAMAQLFYNGALGTPMSSQGWGYQGETVPSGGSVSATTGFSGGATVTDTTPVATDRAGWATGRLVNGAFPILNRTTGYAVTIDLALGSESHSNNNRAGLSWLTIGSDGFGVELGIWNDSVWAQGNGFVRSEAVSLDPTVRSTYTLAVSGLSYSLSNSGGTLLTGSLRNYFANGAPLVPYGAFQNYVFLGDNTSQAAAQFSVYSVAVVPEPSTYATVAGGLLIPAALWLRRRNRG
jgi:hypothetical protein